MDTVLNEKLQALAEDRLHLYAARFRALQEDENFQALVALIKLELLKNDPPLGSDSEAPLRAYGDRKYKEGMNYFLTLMHTVISESEALSGLSEEDFDFDGLNN